MLILQSWSRVILTKEVTYRTSKVVKVRDKAKMGSGWKGFELHPKHIHAWWVGNCKEIFSMSNLYNILGLLVFCMAEYVL